MRRQSFKCFLLSSAAVALYGCGTQYSLKEFSPNAAGPKTALIDIKQRAIISGARKSASATDAEVITCAEPSPDALSSLASEFALDAKVRDSLQTSLGFSQQEAASFVGLRTQTIQLLRDGMYRLCEGYLSGALTQADFAWLSRRYQRNMVALLTIEQLTRVSQVPTVAQASEGLASASRSAAAIQVDLEEIDKSSAKLAEEKKKIAEERAELEKLPDADSSKTEKLKANQSKLDAKQAAIARTEEVRSAMLDGLRTARGVLTSGRTTVQIYSNGQDNRSTLGTGVVDAIARITNEVITQDDLPTLCFQLLDGSRDSSNKATTELKESCTKFLVARANFEAERTDTLRKGIGDQPSGAQLKSETRFLSKEVDGALAERLRQQFPEEPKIPKASQGKRN